MAVYVSAKHAVEGYSGSLDELSVQVKAALSGPVEALYPELQGTNVRSQS